MHHIIRRTSRSLVITAAMALLGTAPAAFALQITTDWHEEPTQDPQGQLATPVIAAAVRNNNHIYELHLICGGDQYDGDSDDARKDGPVLELAVSTFGENEKAAAIDTNAGEADSGPGIDVGLTVGSMSRVTQRFRAEKYPNVISAAFGSGDALGDNGPAAGSQFDQAAADNAGITVYKVLGHESVTLPFSRDNDQVKRFLTECPVTAGH